MKERIKEQIVLFFFFFFGGKFSLGQQELLEIMKSKKNTFFSGDDFLKLTGLTISSIDSNMRRLAKLDYVEEVFVEVEATSSKRSYNVRLLKYIGE